MSTNTLDIFKSYIKNTRLFTEKEIKSIISLVKLKELKKNEYLLSQGNVCAFHTFVCSGCLRSYRIDERGREHIFSFSTVNHWVSDHVSLITRAISAEWIDALEDSIIVQLSVDDFNTLSRKTPNIEVLHTKIIIDDYCRNRERIYMMTNHQAEERYRHFIRLYPQLHHRLPIFMIASYIGVTRETLTRIRSNMAGRKSVGVSCTKLHT